MPRKMTLSDGVDAYLAHRRSTRKAASTIQSDEYILRRFLTTTGNLYVHNIRESHVDEHFNVSAQTRSEQSLGVDHQVLGGFFRWAVRNGLMLRTGNPMDGRVKPAYTPRPWRGLHVSKFPALLDAAVYPRDRMLIAIGLYALGRAKELTTIRIRDVQLEAARIAVNITKTHKTDRIPIGLELDIELRKWLELYAGECGPLDPDWYLLPTKTRPTLITQLGTGRGIPDRSTVRLIPTKPIYGPHLIVKAALEEVGYPVRDPNGKPLNEGMHTLRRSGARALYDEYVAAGYPDALRRVQVVLGHRSVRTTEHYIGIEPDRELRDQTIAGKLMFPSLAGIQRIERSASAEPALRVTRLRSVNGGEGHQGVRHP